MEGAKALHAQINALVPSMTVYWSCQTVRTYTELWLVTTAAASTWSTYLVIQHVIVYIVD